MRLGEPFRALRPSSGALLHGACLAVALFVQPRVRVAGPFMRFVGALLAMEVRAIAAIGIGTVLCAEAFVRGPGLERAALKRAFHPTRARNQVHLIEV